MALYAVSIEKETLYQGVQERFANIYYYEGPTFQAGDENYRRLADELAAAEKGVHGSEVQFRTARVWSSGGTIIQNITLGLFDLTGAGELPVGDSVHAEGAVVVEWECQRPNILGRKVYLRKFIRPQNLPSGSGVAAARGKAALNATAKNPFKVYADRVDNILLSSGVTFVLVSPTGRVPRAPDNGVVNNYVVTREFRRN